MRIEDMDHKKFEYSMFNDSVFAGRTLTRVSFKFCSFAWADFQNCVLQDCRFEQCSFKHSKWDGAQLINVIFTDCDLSYLPLFWGATEVLLRKCNLYGAALPADPGKLKILDCYLASMTIRGDKHPYWEPHFPPVPPETGAFVAYKKAIAPEGMSVIVKLQIPASASRSSATGRKCRASKAKVLAIQGGLKKAYSSFNPRFIYTVGETVVPDAWEGNRFEECSAGIHFFMTRQEAVDY